MYLRLSTDRLQQLARQFPAVLHRFEEELRGRSMLVKRARPLPIECVVRGYLAGSGWKEYQSRQSICGVALPEGLRQAERLPETLFTPSTKAESGSIPDPGDWTAGRFDCRGNEKGHVFFDEKNFAREGE